MAVVKDTDRGRLLTRRAFVLGGIQAGLFAMLFGRLYDLQVRKGERFQTMAEENRISMRLIVPSRGIITDRNGIILAHSGQNFRVDLIPEQTPNVKATLKQLYALLPFEDWEKKRIQHDIRKNRSFMPLLLRDNLEWEQMAMLELHAPELPGVVIEAGETRHYPFAEATAHVLGYTGPPNEQEVKKDPVLNQPGFRVGKTGIERFYDDKLLGETGNVQLEVNAYGRPVRELERQEGTPGHEIKLTLDMELQKLAQSRLAGLPSAAVVLMDVQDGSIYALASQPSFDPNHFTSGVSKDIWNQLANDPLVPLLNKAVLGAYAPGSTFKIVVAIAALAAGVNPKNTFYCPGHLDLGNHRFHCWKKGGHGSVDMHKGIAQSCDVYFYHVGQKIGIEAIHDMAHKLGFGHQLGVDIPHEKTGTIPNMEWKKKISKEPWQAGETLVAAIGQGYIQVTPLQLATMAARIGNAKASVKPHLLQSIKGEKSPLAPFEALGIDEKHLALVRDAMLSVCKPGGTAAASQIPVEGYEMAGKTGTAQVRRVARAIRAKGEVDNETRPWEERDHALFVGFAPFDKPRYAAAAVVEHGGGGAKAAAPIVRDLLMAAMERDPGHGLEKPLVMPAAKPEPNKPEPEEVDEEPVEEDR
jgi:penicillin-binding protein 2